MRPELQSLLGFCVLLLVAWAVSENRRKLAWRTILAGVALQFLLAAMFLKIPPVSYKHLTLPTKRIV